MRQSTTSQNPSYSIERAGPHPADTTLQCLGSRRQRKRQQVRQRWPGAEAAGTAAAGCRGIRPSHLRLAGLGWPLSQSEPSPARGVPGTAPRAAGRQGALPTACQSGPGPAREADMQCTWPGLRGGSGIRTAATARPLHAPRTAPRPGCPPALPLPHQLARRCQPAPRLLPLPQQHPAARLQARCPLTAAGFPARCQPLSQIRQGCRSGGQDPPLPASRQQVWRGRRQRPRWERRRRRPGAGSTSARLCGCRQCLQRSRGRYAR